MIIFQVLFSTSGSFALAFQCDPPRYITVLIPSSVYGHLIIYNRAAYDLSITDATCYSQYKLFQITLYQAVMMFLSDIVILVAPMVILCGLQMPRRKIIALMAIFGSGLYTPYMTSISNILIPIPGGIACISPVVRFSTLDYLRKGTTDLTCKYCKAHPFDCCLQG